MTIGDILALRDLSSLPLALGADHGLGINISLGGDIKLISLVLRWYKALQRGQGMAVGGKIPGYMRVYLSLIWTIKHVFLDLHFCNQRM